MALTVQSLLDAETIRDGGSLAATFLDTDGSKWVLFLTIEQVQHDISETRGFVEKLGFKEPRLFYADPAKRPADTENCVYGDLSGPHHPITWEEAGALVGQITKLPNSLDKWASEALGHLVFAVDNQGGLPPDRARLAPTRRLYPKR